MLPESWRNVERVLAMQVGNQQDLILTIPALQMLRQVLPNAAITLIISPGSRQISLELPWVDEVLVYEGAGRFANAESELTLISQLQQSAFDASVIFTSSGESPYALAYICYLAGIPIRVGQSQEFGGGVLSHCVQPQSLQNHPTEQYIFLLKSIFGNQDAINRVTTKIST